MAPELCIYGGILPLRTNRALEQHTEDGSIAFFLFFERNGDT